MEHARATASGRASGLRRLLGLLSRSETLPVEGLRGQIPVNIRSASEQLALGNRLVSLFVHLPVAESDPLRRYQLVLSEAEHRRHGTQALGAKTLIDITSLAPPALPPCSHGRCSTCVCSTSR